MKIAVFHNLPSGGAKRSLHGLIQCLAEEGHEIELFIPSTADESFLDLRKRVRQTTVIPVRRTLAGAIRSVPYLLPLRFSACDLMDAEKELAGAINSKNFDVVLVEQDRFTMSPFLLKFLNKPHVYFCQQPSRHRENFEEKMVSADFLRLLPQHRLKRHWRRYLAKKMPLMDRKNASFAKYIVANSNFSREAIQRAYGRNAAVCYLGVDTAVFRPIGAQRADYVLSVGSLEPGKGHDFVVRALGRLPFQKRPRLVIIANAGGVSYRDAVERLAEQNQVQLEILKMVQDDELVRYYNQARLFVYAPYLEPFGLAALEAMACGTPVVAVKEGGVMESVIANETGLLVDRDEQEFSNAVVKLLQDPSLAESLARNALEKIGSFWTFRHATQRLLFHLTAAASGTEIK